MSQESVKKLRRLAINIVKAVDEGACDENAAIDQLAEAAESFLEQYQSLNRTDAAKVLGISVRQFDRMRESGTIPEGRKRAGGQVKWSYGQIVSIKRLLGETKK